MLNVQRAALATIGATLAALSIAACDPQSTSSTSSPHAITELPTAYDAPTSVEAIAPTTTAAPNPLTTDGTYLIGTRPGEIAPGTYSVTASSSFGGYWALCADLVCEPGNGMIRNDLVDGPGFLVIPADAKAVELKRVTLTASTAG